MQLHRCTGQASSGTFCLLWRHWTRVCKRQVDGAGNQSSGPAQVCECNFVACSLLLPESSRSICCLAGAAPKSSPKCEDESESVRLAASSGHSQVGLNWELQRGAASCKLQVRRRSKRASTATDKREKKTKRKKESERCLISFLASWSRGGKAARSSQNDSKEQATSCVSTQPIGSMP